MNTPAFSLEGRITLRPKEVAQATGFSEVYVKRLLKSGELPSKRRGDMRLIKVDELKKFIDGLEDA